MNQELHELLDEIISKGKRQDKTQARIAEEAGIGAVTFSRAKRADDIQFSTLQRLAKSVGLRLTLAPDIPIAAKIERGGLFK